MLFSNRLLKITKYTKKFRNIWGRNFWAFYEHIFGKKILFPEKWRYSFLFWELLNKKKKIIINFRAHRPLIGGNYSMKKIKGKILLLWKFSKKKISVKFIMGTVGEILAN